MRRCPPISIHALREEGDQTSQAARLRQRDFYPRPPRGGRLCQSVEPHFSLYFYPRPPRGGRHRGGQERALAILNFYPRPPRGGRPDSNYKSYGAKDFYPRPPRGGRPSGDRAYALTESISIHALREEGDRNLFRMFQQPCNISIHALREEGDQFLSFLFHSSLISIHALREEGDAENAYNKLPAELFLSTPSSRRATYSCAPPRAKRGISIHALLAEGDLSFPGISICPTYFYPRPPRGGRPCHPVGLFFLWDFYPRPPRGGRHLSPGRAFLFVGFLSTPSSRRATAKTARKHPAFVSLYTSLHKLQRDVCKPNRKITPLLAQTAGIPVRSVPENHVCCRFALAGHQKISTLSWANSGCSPTCSTLVW